ncbi:hypothetical protein KXW31_002250 [Aspergillus fumigatus]|nr:hypothetical protein KXX64_003922 [Aspergillus fumigatus]KAH2295236.1 hypothetical protein KXV50_002042 [Aspergillus fumigatus]KAH2490361.1 hypothetical protein KXV28_005286 [Aspergillus fumigatus]KAH2935749.1 hypothetical protein KXW15_004484 [Aspergillus fumigatus]KAH3246220.1 hypothetical protein KXW31_002250 [Aspergillus fumigatus]
MHNVKTLPALLCLLLAVGPTAVLSAPIADVASLDKRQVTHSNTDAASVVGAGIPDGPSFNQGDFFSTSSDEQRDEDCDEDEDNDGSSSSPSASSSSNTGAASFVNAGIPDGPSFNQNDFFSTSNDEDRDVGDGDDGSQSGFSTSTDAGNFATFGIPDGPSATFGKAFHHDYEEAHSKHPETTPVPEPSPPTPTRQLPPLIIPVPAVERP